MCNFMVSSQKKALGSTSSENELSTDQTLGLVSLSLMQKLSQKDPSFSWLVDTKYKCCLFSEKRGPGFV